MNRSRPVQFAIRVLIYCFALFLTAVGVVLALNSNLGISPVNSFPYVLSQIFHVQQGTCVTVVFCCFILLQILILRKDFRIINLLQIVFATIFGYFVDFAKKILGDFAIPTYFGQLTMLAISIFLIALGVQMYMDTKLVPMPAEGLSSTIAFKLGKPFPTLKTALDCSMLIGSITLSLLFLGKLDGIREGTIITAVSVGKTIAILSKKVSPVIQKLCFGDEP